MPALNGEGAVLLTDDIICAEALRLLKNNLVYGRIASKRYSASFADVGQTVNVQLAARVKGTLGRTIGIQPMVKKTVALTIDSQYNIGVTWTMKDKMLSIGDFGQQFLKSAVVQMANYVDADIALKTLNAGFYSSGTAGTPINQDTILDGMAIAELTGMPRDGMCSVVLDPRDRAAIAKALEGKFNEKMVSDAIRKGYIGPIDDVETYSSANAQTHTTGLFTTGSTSLVNGANQSGSSIITDGWANSTAILTKGDIIYFAGVYSVNPQTYVSTGILMPFTVTAALSSSGAGAATIAISPAMNDGNQFSLDASGNSISTRAYQNVSALPADNAVITKRGTESTRYREAPIFHVDALALAVPPMPPIASAVIDQTMTDDETGLSIKLSGGYDVVNNAEIMRLDIIWGFQVVQPELVHRLIGASV